MARAWDDLEVPWGDLSESTDTETDEIEDLDSSWLPIDLGPAYRGEKVRPVAEVLRRDDGVALLLPGLNWIHGMDGTGKSLAGAIATSQEIKAGFSVLWLSYEDANEDLLVERLKLLGASETETGLVKFITPGEGLTNGAAWIARLAADTGARLVVVDSVGEAMAVGGVDEDKDAQVGPWIRNTLRVIHDSDPELTILPIDHGVKSGDNPLFPSGSKRKRAAVTGRAFLLNVRQEFAIGQIGYVQLVVAKDRGGTFRRGDIAAEIMLDATASPYRYTVSSGRDGDSFDPKHTRRNAAERVREVLGETAVAVTAEQITRIANGPDRIQQGEAALSIKTVKNSLTKLAEGPEVAQVEAAGRTSPGLWLMAERTK